MMHSRALIQRVELQPMPEAAGAQAHVNPPAVGRHRTVTFVAYYPEVQDFKAYGFGSKGSVRLRAKRLRVLTVVFKHQKVTGARPAREGIFVGAGHHSSKVLLQRKTNHVVEPSSQVFRDLRAHGWGAWVLGHAENDLS